MVGADFIGDMPTLGTVDAPRRTVDAGAESNEERRRRSEEFRKAAPELGRLVVANLGSQENAGVSFAEYGEVRRVDFTVPDGEELGNWSGRDVKAWAIDLTPEQEGRARGDVKAAAAIVKDINSERFREERGVFVGEIGAEINPRLFGVISPREETDYKVVMIGGLLTQNVDLDPGPDVPDL